MSLTGCERSALTGGEWGVIKVIKWKGLRALEYREFNTRVSEQCESEIALTSGEWSVINRR